MKYSDGIYIEDDHRIAGSFLPEEIYAQALSSLIIVCADVAIICPHKKLLFLAKRVVSPMPGFWTIGGRRFAGESGASAAQRNLSRETGIKPDINRFTHVTNIEVIWATRKEQPAIAGKHDIINFFSVEMSSDEINQVNQNLLKTEYLPLSLTPFNHENLKKNNINPVMQHLYKKIFN
ncbi:NUDIX domain-containing protein [bacterium]|nr:NUDIX domain-containing protein [bacterium]